MTTIGYYGHLDSFDDNMRIVIIKKLEFIISLLEYENDFTILVHHIFGTMDRCIYSAVQQVKEDYMNKNISFVCVNSQYEENRVGVDEVRVIPDIKPSADHWVNRYHSYKYIIQQSDFLLLYNYPQMYANDRRLSSLIKKQQESRSMVVIDLCQRETKELVSKLVQRLSEKQQFVLSQTLAGKNNGEIGKVLGLGNGRVRQILLYSGFRLQRMLITEMNKQRGRA